MRHSKSIDPREHSRVVVDGAKQAPSRAMLRAVGFRDEDFAKPQIGVASTWGNVTPCNMHIGELAREACAGVDAAGGKSVLFNTITVSDGISMGTPGMRYSLVSREVIADSIETVVGAAGFDGFVAIGGCDKNMPGCAMAMARLNRPAVFVYGGTIRPGVAAARHHFRVRGGRRPCGREALGRGAARDRAHRHTRARAAAAACTPPTPWPRQSRPWACPCPAAPPRRRSGEDKRADCRRAGEAVVRLVREGLKPRDILTRTRLRERHHRGHRARGLDQRRAAPARHRTRRAVYASRSMTSRASASASRCWRTSSRAGAT